jgi:hypothetical protein
MIGSPFRVRLQEHQQDGNDKAEDDDGFGDDGEDKALTEERPVLGDGTDSRGTNVLLSNARAYAANPTAKPAPIATNPSTGIFFIPPCIF